MKKNTLKHYCPTINVENLWSLLGNEAREHYAKEKSGKAPVVNLVKHVSFFIFDSVIFFFVFASVLPVNRFETDDFWVSKGA